MKSLKLFHLLCICVLFIISIAWAERKDLILLSQDPYTDAAGGQHSTEVEPMMAAHGSTIVTAFQVARFQGTGSENIGWATSLDRGTTWKRGLLSGTTTIAGGSWYSVSLPIVVFNSKFNFWLISLTGYDNQGNSYGVYISRSYDGLKWSKPTPVVTSSTLDKEWIACDNSHKSPNYGNCYAAWFDTSSFIDYFTVSKDGGSSWSSPIASPDQATGELGSMVVQPNGHVIMVGTYGGLNFDQEYSIQSVDGGTTLNASVNFSTFQFNFPAQGAMRADPFPTSGVDSKGVVYVVYPDCRFRPNCATNDLVLTTTSDGINWSPLQRIPIDPVTSGADHFITGLGVSKGLDDDFGEDGSPTRLALGYYYFPNGNCDINSCELHAGFISSQDGGSAWSPFVDVAGPVSLNWLATTVAGQMVGNNISAIFVSGVPFSAYALAQPPNPKTGKLNEAIFAAKFEGE